jgi:hypothetical protein
VSLERNDSAPRAQEKPLGIGLSEDSTHVRHGLELLARELLAPLKRFCFAKNMSQGATLEVELDDADKIKPDSTIDWLDIGRVVTFSVRKVFEGYN